MRDIVCISFILFLVLDQLGDFCYYFEKKMKIKSLDDFFYYITFYLSVLLLFIMAEFCKLTNGLLLLFWVYILQILFHLLWK